MKNRILILAAVTAVLAFNGCFQNNDEIFNDKERALGAVDCSSCSTLGVDAPDAVIPYYPFWSNDAIDIDLDLVRESASMYRAEKGDAASAPEFYMGYLPLWSADRLCGGAIDKGGAASLLGNLYISGYFGGLWLRDAIAGDEQSIEEAQAPLRSMLEDASGTEPDFSGSRPVFTLLTSIARLKVNTAISGNELAMRMADRLSLDPFLMLYGYNWGYFMYILENPPDGMAPPDVYDSVCPRFMDCDMPGVTLDTLEKYQPVLDSLYAPKTPRWYEVNLLMHLWGEGAVATGEGVWENIMASSRMSQASTYGLLLDLSGRFMMMAELSLLPAMKGYAEGDMEAGRCGLLQEAAMIVWAGSYFMGLGSGQPAGTFPELLP